MPVLKDLNGNQISYNVAGLPVNDQNGPVVWVKTQSGANINIS